MAFASIGYTSDNTRPTLISITPGETTVDVSESEQTVIFTIDATDESGIDWNSSFIYFRTTRNYCYREDTDGEVVCTFSSRDNDGTIYLTAFIYDNAGNRFIKNAATSITLIGGNISPVVNNIILDQDSIDVSDQEKTINFFIDVTDTSGINWKRSYIQFPYTASTGKYCYGVDNIPNIISCTFSSGDPGGELNYRVRIEDIHGSYFYDGSYGSIWVEGGRERTPPVLQSISNDKIGIDLSQQDQIIHYHLSATDSSGIDWSNSQIALRRGNDFSVYATGNGSNSSAGVITVPFGTNLQSGIWYYAYIKVTDNLGNERLYGFPELAQFGLADSIHLYKSSDSASDLEVSKEFVSEQVSAGASFTHSFKITNKAQTAAEDLQLTIKGSNLFHSSISFASLSSACTSSVSNNRLSLSCSLSSLPAGDSEEFSLIFTAGQPAPANYSLEIATNDPDKTYDDNRALVSLEVMADADSDGMPDAWEEKYGLNPNDPTDSTSDQDNDGATALEEFLAGTIPSLSIDLDGNDNYDALTDGLLLLKSMLGFSGDFLVANTIADDAIYTESQAIESRIEALGDLADVDGNGDMDALTDGLLTLRYLLGMEGEELIKDAIASNATRTTATDIEAHMKTLTP